MTKRVLMIVVLGSILILAAGCKPDYPNCKKDSHCHGGEYCVNNLCQQCRDNGDCPDGQECAAGGCRDIPDYCQDSADCANGQICRDNTCGPCMQASDCAPGTVCMDGLCAVAECKSTDDCPAGLSCVNYRCEVDNSAASGLGPGDCVLEPVFFQFDSHDVDSQMRRVLQANLDCLNARGGKVILEGHCDASGTTEYNMALGERRGRMVHKLMSTLGYEKKKMRVISKGEEEATGHGESGRAQDRRVDFE